MKFPNGGSSIPSKTSSFFRLMYVQFLIFVTILVECKAQGDSCGSRVQRSARLMEVASCDLTVNDYCAEAGSQYPWRDMMKFVIENRAVMTRMYGEIKESSVVESEISAKQGRSMNIGRKASKGKEYIQFNRPKAPDKKKAPQYTVSYSSSKKTAGVSEEPSSTIAKPTSTEEVNVTSTDVPATTVTDVIDEESDTSDETITIFKEDSYFISEQQLGERNEEIDLKDFYYDTMKTITVMKETTPATTAPSPPTTTEQAKTAATTTYEPTTTQTVETTTTTTTTTPDPTTAATKSEDYYDVGDESSGETWGYAYEPISACQAQIEYFTPYWANNTRGETLALINIHPYEQYVHSEKCVNLNKQDNCKEGCKCEQQYRLYRLLAYDPSNDCRGIFADWFRLPGCCICMCYNIVPTSMPPTMSPSEFLFKKNMSSHRQGRKSIKPIPLRYRKDQH